LSRVGKKNITLPKGVTCTREGSLIKIKGPKGELHKQFHPAISVDISDSLIQVNRPDDTKVNKALHGLTRALIQNMVTGVSNAYKKTLDIVGVGYKAELKGKNLLLSLGYSHPIYFMPPEGIVIETPSQIQIIISGIDKELVGLVAAKIRSFREPEPYKGKGIKYSDEHIIRKAGKTAG